MHAEQSLHTAKASLFEEQIVQVETIVTALASRSLAKSMPSGSPLAAESSVFPAHLIQVPQYLIERSRVATTRKTDS
jgi:hypothetical protein